jgi:carbon starvation protein
MKKILAAGFWIALAIAGAAAYATLAFHRGEPLSSVYILVAALCTYAIGYRFYSKWIAARVLLLDDRRATPCEVHDDGKDFCKTNKWIVFGHHFAAISGPGPLVGPVLAAQFGYLPGALWILIGVVLGGAVQDFVILFVSLRRNGKSLGQMVKEELNTPAGYLALVAILAIMIILLAVLALVVVKALAESPWGIFTVGATIPIALFMGSYLRFWRVGKVLEASAIGVILLLLAVWGGKLIHESPYWSETLRLNGTFLAWSIIGYGFAASVLPVWLLLAPRDYLSTFMKLGTIGALAVGIFLVRPHLEMPALTPFTNGLGLVVPGKIFPFCFITIACGAISGFHTLIASGTTPKIIARESHARPIGYGAMCLESFVAIMALIAACTLQPGIYLGMNVASTGADSQARAAAITQKVQAAGAPFVVSAEAMDQLAADVKEKTLFNRAGGAATLAAGMANVFSKVTHGRGLDLWYHFAIMFEALFILTTLDAGTRVGRYILQDFLGNVWKPLGHTKRIGPNLLASGLMVCGWGYFLIQGVLDPLGGINSLWPLFGIANQMLAAMALCLATTILLKMSLQTGTAEMLGARQRSPAIALVTLLPLLWLVSATFTAGVQKIWHPSPRIGFLANASDLNRTLPALEQEASRRLLPGLEQYESWSARRMKPVVAPRQRELEQLQAAAAAAAPTAAGTDAAAKLTAFLAREGPLLDLYAAKKAVADNRTLRFNNLLDAVVAGFFLALVSAILLSSVREWILLLARRKAAELHETPPVWLPEYALAKSRPWNFFSLIALGFALAKELSGEAQLERARQEARLNHAGDCCPSRPVPVANGKSAETIYLETTEQRFNGIRRCC